MGGVKVEKIKGNLIIGEEKKPSVSNKDIEVYNPANGEVVGSVARGTEKDVNIALENAQKVFPIWRNTSFEERAEFLHSFAESIKSRKNEIAEILTREQGKPLSEAISEVETVSVFFHFYAEQARRIEGGIVKNQKENYKSFIIKKPVGVCALIGPWNYPLILLGQKIAPALAAGCTVVVKPPTLTPLAAYKMIECIFENKKFKPGTLNFITGTGKVVGNSLAESSLTDKISFTGSTETGKKLIKASAEKPRPLSFELGGHSPIIIWEDADLETAIAGVTKRSFRNMGQICNSLNRIYVHKNIFDEFVNGFISKTKELKIGNGLKAKIDLGPMASKEGIKKVKEHIKDAKLKGAKILFGGEVPEGKKYEQGNFFKPTILTNMSDDMLMMNEETFGPVAPLVPIKDADEAIKLANNTRYGLVSYAYTSDLRLAHKFAEEMEAGTVVINHVSPTSLYAPYGGIKESGFGRELGRFGLDEYLYKKHVHINLGEQSV